MNFSDVLENRTKRNNIYLLFFLIICIFVLLSLCFGKGVWADEMFTFMTIDKSWYDMMLFTAGDVHPPLYYCIVKLVIVIFGNDILTVKLVTALGFFGLIALGVTKVRRNWGGRTAFLFLLSVMCMPQMLFYAVQLRMYSWAMFFVTLTLLELYDIVLGQEKRRTWIVIALSGLAAAYTHYFALLAIAIIYLVLLLWCIFNKRKLLKYCMMVFGISILGYLPWLGIFIKQITVVRDDYWIEPITLKGIAQMFSFVFVPQEVFWGVLLVILYVVAIVCFGIRNRKESSVYDTFGGIVFFGVFLLGIILSVLIRPIFVARYLVPSMPALYLMFSLMLRKANKYVYLLAVITILGVGISSYTELYADEYPVGMKETQEYLEDNITEGDILISDIGVAVVALMYYYPDCQCFHYPEIDEANMSTGAVWVFDTTGTTASDMEKQGYQLEECYPDGRLDRMEFTLYRMKKGD